MLMLTLSLSAGSFSLFKCLESDVLSFVDNCEHHVKDTCCSSKSNTQQNVNDECCTIIDIQKSHDSYTFEGLESFTFEQPNFGLNDKTVIEHTATKWSPLYQAPKNSPPLYISNCSFLC